MAKLRSAKEILETLVGALVECERCQATGEAGPGRHDACPDCGGVGFGMSSDGVQAALEAREWLVDFNTATFEG